MAPVPVDNRKCNPMAKSKAPRKKYRPKPNDPVAIRFSEEDERNFQLMPHAELFNLRQGLGTAESWDTLELRLKWGQALARLKALPGAQALFDQAVSHLVAVHQRFVRLQQYGLSGDEGAAIGEGLGLADELQLASTRRELRDTLNQTLAGLKSDPAPTGRLNCFVA